MKNMALFTMLCASSALLVAGCTESTTSTGTAPAAATMSGGIAMPAGLTAEEQLIWNSLSDQAKRDAVAYMEAGGSFKDFVAV
jgi:hypothetical protein